MNDTPHTFRSFDLPLLTRIVPYIGLVYKSKGRDRDGVDCWGLCHLVYREQLGITLPEYAEGYTDSAELEEVAKLVVEGRANWVQVSPPKPGDVVLLKIFREPVHVGVYVGERKMLHVRKGTNACIERLDGPFWRTRLEGFYRYVG